MMKRQVYFLLVLLSAWTIGVSGGTARAAGEDGSPAAFIESLANKAIAALTTDSVPRSERIVRFRKLLNEHFAVRTIGRWVLGRYWNKATDAERQEYFKLFENLIVNTYVDRFTTYSGEQLTIVKTVPATESDVLVQSEITRPKGSQPVSVTWRLRTMDGHFKIVDVIVEGVSMGQTQRAEFASVIRRSGGTVEGLLAKLREDSKGGA